MFLLINVCLNVTFIREKGGKGRPQIMLSGNMISMVCENLPVKEFFIKNGVLIYSYSSLH